MTKSDLPPTKPRRIPELDGLRAFAVLCVVLHHMSDFAGSLPRGTFWIAEVITFLGPNGVNIFFIISGYIITTLLLRERASSGQVSLKAFYIRRFFRIVPPFFTYLLGLLALKAFGAIFISHTNLFWSALFLGNTDLLDLQAWFVGHTWSLSVEEQFYLVFPPLLCVVLVFRAKPVVLVMCILYGLCLVSRRLALELSSHVAPQWIVLNGLHPFRYIIVGVVLATHGSSLLSLLANRSRIWPCSFVLLDFVLHRINVPEVVSMPFAAAEPFLCGLFVMWFMQNPDRCAILRSPGVQWLGACSYSIYLWQQLFTAPAQFYLGWKFGQSPWSIIAILVCAAISFYLIEKPSMRLGRFLSRQTRMSKNVNDDSIPQSA